MRNNIASENSSRPSHDFSSVSKLFILNVKQPWAFAEQRSHGLKIPCWMANDTAGQEKQGNYITQKANILSFQGPLRCLPSRALLRRVDGLGNYRSKACSIASCSNLNNSSSLFQFNPQTVGSESTNLTSKGVAVTKPTVLTYPVYNLAAVKLVKTDAICESVVS